MATITKTEVHHESKEEIYLRVFIALGVLTLIEVIIGSQLETDIFKVVLLMTLAIGKAALVAAVFMHIKYDKNPKLIIGFSFILPLLGGLFLTLTLWKDYRA